MSLVMGMFNPDLEEEKFFGDAIINDRERKSGKFELAFSVATTVYSPETPVTEGVARTLREIAALVDKCVTQGAVRDINGDVIGSWVLKVPRA